MPEIDVLHAFSFNIQRVVDRYAEKHGEPLQGSWEFFFRSFALGTKAKKYTTMTVESWDYNPTSESAPDHYHPNSFDKDRLNVATFKHLQYLLKPLNCGEVSVTCRGKELIVAAGFHAVRIHLGLEASICVMSLEDYRALTAQCRPGPNKNKAKAKRLRSFILPSRFVVPGSPHWDHPEDRYVNVFAAVVCQDHAIVIMDFSRLVRLHVMSLGRHWDSDDLTPGSEFWHKLWDTGHGPDWVTERDEALAVLDMWRGEMQVQDNLSAETPIIASLYGVQSVFNGLGKHTANDLLHLAGVWPGMPTSALCANNELFDRFRSILVNYMALWSSPKFLKLVAPPSNDHNPFAFNYRSHRLYISQYVHVYRKSFCCVDQELYNYLVSHGLLDPDHHLGELYQPADKILTDKVYKPVPVGIYKVGSVKFYSVIRAARPESWKCAANGPLVRPGNLQSLVAQLQTIAPDMRHLASTTTVGVASFREMVENFVDITVKWRPGRKRINRTGKPGRPAKDPWKADVERALRVVAGYRYRMRAQLLNLAVYQWADEEEKSDIEAGDLDLDDDTDSDDDIPLSIWVGGRGDGTPKCKRSRNDIAAPCGERDIHCSTRRLTRAQARRLNMSL